jgi:hypothetical protein
MSVILGRVDIQDRAVKSGHARREYSILTSQVPKSKSMDVKRRSVVQIPVSLFWKIIETTEWDARRWTEAPHFLSSNISQHPQGL